MRKTLIALLLVCTPLHADDDTFRERFADPATRTAALAELIPGTRDSYFHTALDHQLAGREEDFLKTVAEWKAAGERKENPVPTGGLDVLENRQLLMNYQKSPVQSLAGLIRKLDLKFDDTRPDTAAAAESLPTKVDPAVISEAAFEKLALEETPAAPYTQYRGERLLRELDQVESFDEAKIRWFVQNLQRADLPGVVPLVDRALEIDHTFSFEGGLLSSLTVAQLDSLLALHPDLRTKNSFALVYLNKLRPGSETDLEVDTAAHAEHLRRCRDFAIALPPTQNSLKAHVLYHHLRLQAELGNFPKSDLLTYLSLPRGRAGLVKAQQRPAEETVNPNHSYSSATSCPPVRDDTELVEELLRHFLSTDSAADFSPYIEEKQLAQLQARARMLAGDDAAVWGKPLDPADFKELQEKSAIIFSKGAPKLLDGDASVSLTLDLKNTPSLLVRIYELDLPAHLANHGSEPSVDIDLDGLVPHHERSVTFAQAPLLQHRETIDLPELAGPGAWLVDFTSGQVSARALIRKGRLVSYPQRTATGQTVRVFDEKGNPVPSASIALGRESFSADVDGLITIPDAPNQPVTRGLVRAGKLATPVSLETRGDELAMDARFHLDREQLLADQEARLHLRVRLTNHGHELPLDRIQEPALVLKAELLGGVTTERVIAENLTLSPVMEIPFQVPADLLKLTLTLRGTVTPATGGDAMKLSQDRIYQVNTDLKESRVGTAFFSPTAEGHRMEVRGRNGEPLPSRAITLRFTRQGFFATSDREPQITVEVRTDENGRVHLGALDGIEFLRASGSDIQTTAYIPKRHIPSQATEIHVLAGQDIRLPLEERSEVANRLKLSLLEYANNQSTSPVRDHFSAISIESGQVMIKGLPPGTYKLAQSRRTTDITVSSGKESAGLIVSPGLISPVKMPVNPTIATARAGESGVRIQLSAIGPDTRVTLVGKRYEDFPWDTRWAARPFQPTLPGAVSPGFSSCGYLTDRLVSDEMRYILDRRAVNTFPGVMLPRPSLLLNRWSADNLNQITVQGDGGLEGNARGGISREARQGAGSYSGETEGVAVQLADVRDFLRFPAAVRYDLKPEADGTVTVPLAEFEGSQFIEVIVTDAFASDSLVLPLPANDTPLRDRRIARPLDPQAHHLASRSAAVLKQGAEASIENLLDADWRAFTTLTEAHQFLYGMRPDDRLREFVFLTEWPTFSEEKKLELLEKHTCHELHLFLARKDTVFFDKFVKPRLAGKAEPRFMDDYLLGRDLTAYLRPFAWNRLNAAEKALLSQALPDARATISRELSLRWELEAPTPDAETTLFTQTLRGSDLALQDSLGLAKKDLMESDTVAYGEPGEMGGAGHLNDKLKRIIIPRIDFANTTVEEAIDFLRLRAAELDTSEVDPAKKGVNFVIRRPRKANPAMDDIPGGSDPGARRVRGLHIKNAPLSKALKYICDQTKLRYKVDDFAVTLVPQTESGEDIFTRTFSVVPDFASSLDDSPGAAKRPIKDLLMAVGIVFAEGSSAKILPNGTLLVTNTPSELDKVAQLTAHISSSDSDDAVEGGTLPDLDSPVGAAVGGITNGLLSGDQAINRNNIDAILNNPNRDSSDTDAFSDADPFAEPSPENAAKLTARKPMLQPRLPTFPERTRLWRESNYYRNTRGEHEGLIPLNRFWMDLAAWDGQGPFLSPHFNACHTTVNEALMCLALLDLPFKSERPEVVVDGSTLRVKAREPMLLFYKDTRKTENLAPESPLLVRQTFTPFDEPFRTVNGRKVENPVTGDFRPGVGYKASLIVTNPTGIGRRIDLLAQIPAGSIPLGGKPATRSSTHELAPYGVVTEELAFYFPAAGDFPVYPLHVNEEATVLAHTQPRTLRVSDEPAPQDAASWGVLASNGTDEEVLNRLATENLRTIDLGAIRWRLKDALFFQNVSKLLRERLYFSAEVTAYGFRHNDVPAMREYLENAGQLPPIVSVDTLPPLDLPGNTHIGLANDLGRWLDSPLLDVRPLVHLDWETLEFDPLVNPRAHRFGDKPRLTHEAARAYYHKFLGQLAWKPVLDDADQLNLTALLFLQDRIEEGLARFALIDPAKLPGRLNYDYLHAVVLFHRENPQEAKAIAAAVLPTLPPGLWSERFQAVIDQADEVVALGQPGEADKPAEEVSAPELDLAAGDGGKLVVHHRSLEKATLRLFSVDLEVLFSTNPFLKGDAGTAQPAILPNASFEIALAKDATETTVELPESLRKGNVLVSADSGSRKLLKVLDSRAIELRHLPQDRIVQVLDSADHRPLAKTYVKVYAETRSGEVVFHKDGYTDLRGKFDYLSHTGIDISTVKRIAVLVSHPEKGARTVIYDQ